MIKLIVDFYLFIYYLVETLIFFIFLSVILFNIDCF